MLNLLSTAFFPYANKQETIWHTSFQYFQLFAPILISIRAAVFSLLLCLFAFHNGFTNMVRLHFRAFWLFYARLAHSVAATVCCPISFEQFSRSADSPKNPKSRKERKDDGQKRTQLAANGARTKIKRSDWRELDGNARIYRCKTYCDLLFKQFLR